MQTIALPPTGRFATFAEEEVRTIRNALHMLESRSKQAERRSAAALLASETYLGTPLEVPAAWK